MGDKPRGGKKQEVRHSVFLLCIIFNTFVALWFFED